MLQTCPNCWVRPYICLTKLDSGASVGRYPLRVIRSTGTLYVPWTLRWGAAFLFVSEHLSIKIWKSNLYLVMASFLTLFHCTCKFPAFLVQNFRSFIHFQGRLVQIYAFWSSVWVLPCVPACLDTGRVLLYNCSGRGTLLWSGPLYYSRVLTLVCCLVISLYFVWFLGSIYYFYF